MQKTCDNHYKLCRKNAGYRQPQAAELLHISDRSLSDYETGRTRVPDDIVASMSDLYNSPLLAWWHLKETSILGRFLPDIVMPRTHGDMAFQLVLAEDDLSPVVASMKKIMCNGRVDEYEQEEFTTNIQLIKQINGKLIAVVAYAVQLEKRRYVKCQRK